MYYSFLNIWYLKKIFNIKLKVKNVNALTTLPNSINRFLLFKTKKTNYTSLGIKYFNEIVYLFLVNIWLKNVKNICIFIQKKLNSIHFKKHRKYFLFFFKLINKIVVPNFKLLKIKGVYLRFKGKLGRGGNSRKTTLCLRKGITSLSNKSIAVDLHKWDVWSKTGSIGCILRLFY